MFRLGRCQKNAGRCRKMPHDAAQRLCTITCSAGVGHFRSTLLAMTTGLVASSDDHHDHTICTADTVAAMSRPPLPGSHQPLPSPPRARMLFMRAHRLLCSTSGRSHHQCRLLTGCHVTDDTTTFHDGCHITMAIVNGCHMTTALVSLVRQRQRQRQPCLPSPPPSPARCSILLCERWPPGFTTP